MLEVPERWFGKFESEFPHQDTFADPAASVLPFAKAGLTNLIEYTARTSALRIEATGIFSQFEPAAFELFDNAAGWIADVANMQAATNVPDAIIGAVDSASNVMAAMGAFSSVPILGAIIEFVTIATEGIISAYAQTQVEVVEAVSMGYSRESDTDYAQDAVKLYAGNDLTRLFLPANDASEGIDELNIDVETGWHGAKSVVKKAMFVPRGVELGLGALPNTVKNPRAWQTPFGGRPLYEEWGRFKPAFTQGAMQSWQGLLPNSRATYLVDAVRLSDAWREWGGHMRAWATGPRYSEGMRHRAAGLLTSTASLGVAAKQRVRSDGFETMLPWVPYSGDGIHVVPTIADFGQWAAMAQLFRRQRKYLGTLTVAYCSETDPAFASSPELRDLLATRRAMLLDHPAVNQVELGQVVDADYRQAIANRQGPKGLADKPAGGIGGPTRLAGSVPKVGAPVQGPAFASASPMLGGTARRSNSQVGAAALMLLSFLGKR
jgi:hypothetical protein